MLWKTPFAPTSEVLSRLTSASRTHSSVCAAIDDFFWPKSTRNRQSLEESAPRDLDLAVVLPPANCTERKPDDRQFGRSRSTDDCMQVKLSDVSLWPKDACGDGKVGQTESVLDRSRCRSARTGSRLRRKILWHLACAVVFRERWPQATIRCQVTKDAVDRVTRGVFLREPRGCMLDSTLLAERVLWGHRTSIEIERLVIVFAHTERRLVSKGTCIHHRNRTARRDSHGTYGRFADCGSRLRYR